MVEVHGHAKQGAGFGYNRIRGLNGLLATLTTGGDASGPVIVAQPLRKGACNSSRGAKRLVMRRDRDRPPAFGARASHLGIEGLGLLRTRPGARRPAPGVPTCR